MPIPSNPFFRRISMHCQALVYRGEPQEARRALVPLLHQFKNVFFTETHAGMFRACGPEEALQALSSQPGWQTQAQGASDAARA